MFVKTFLKIFFQKFSKEFLKNFKNIFSKLFEILFKYFPNLFNIFKMFFEIFKKKFFHKLFSHYSSFLIAHSLLHSPCSLLLAPNSLFFILEHSTPLSWSLTLKQLQLVYFEIVYLFSQFLDAIASREVTLVGRSAITFKICHRIIILCKSKVMKSF